MKLAHTTNQSQIEANHNHTATAHEGQPDDLVELFWRTRWDFFTGGNASKSGYVTDLTESGCVLKTDEPIEFRRWIRMMIRDSHTNVSFTAVGRVIRCESSFEASIGSDITLYRYGIEFTYPVAVANHPTLGAAEMLHVAEPPAALVSAS